MNLVTDRTEADVLLGNEKGQYTYSDLNRVETAVQELAALAERLNANTHPIVKTDWTLPVLFSMDTWPTESQMRRYLGNVADLCEACAVAADLPESMHHLSWEGANNIEKALEAVLERIQIVLGAFRYSGELIAGEEIPL